MYKGLVIDDNGSFGKIKRFSVHNLILVKKVITHNSMGKVPLYTVGGS